LALLVGGYQVWAAFQLSHIASTYSDGLDFLVRGDTHYTTAFHDFVVWLRTEAGLSGAAAIALLIGAVLLVVRKAAGWRLMVLRCVVVVATPVSDGSWPPRCCAGSSRSARTTTACCGSIHPKQARDRRAVVRSARRYRDSRAVSGDAAMVSRRFG